MKRGCIVYLIGGLLIANSLGFLAFSFKDVLAAEIQYRFGSTKSELLSQDMTVKEDFAISVPKVGINAKVFAEVDPFNKEEYSKALKQGAAHAQGTAYPGNQGNVFIFAHSTSSQNLVTRYNAIFYLLNKLEKGDEVQLTYGKDNFKYKVVETRVITPEEVSYLNKKGNQKTVTLMTCWPAGTTWKRLLVIGELT